MPPLLIARAAAEGEAGHQEVYLGMLLRPLLANRWRARRPLGQCEKSPRGVSAGYMDLPASRLPR